MSPPTLPSEAELQALAPQHLATFARRTATHLTGFLERLPPSLAILLQQSLANPELWVDDRLPTILRNIMELSSKSPPRNGSMPAACSAYSALLTEALLHFSDDFEIAHMKRHSAMVAAAYKTAANCLDAFREASVSQPELDTITSQIREHFAMLQTASGGAVTPSDI